MTGRLPKIRAALARNPWVKRLAKSLAADPDLRLVNVEPRDDAAVNDCFPSVERQVAEHGGALCCGWQIWEYPGMLMEAEFHGVWRRSDGALVDITPKAIACTQILFLLDPIRTYEGQQVNSVRVPTRKEREIRDWIAANDSKFEFENRGERANQHAIELDAAESSEHRRVMEQVRAAGAALFALLDRSPVPPALAATDMCPCGSGLRYQRCCRRG